MSRYLVATKQFDNSDENQNKFIIGKSHFENINQNETFSTIKKFFETKFQLVFDSQGGNTFESIEVILGKPYGELPIPTKTQNIFLGWFTASSGGTQITSETLVSLDINTLYAQWEEIQIDSDCTSYKVTTTSSYKNTGIYQASTYNSNEYTYIDWGDGNVEKFKGNISQKTHTYKIIGTFTVKVSNNLTSFGISYSNSAWYNSTSQNRYTFKEMLTTGSRITSLPQYAFYYCQAMTNIDFMQTCFSNVTSLPNYCFYYCTGLTSIQGAKRFTNLGSYCFQYCSGLTGVQDLQEFKFTTLPNSYTFANCQNVTQWLLPNGFTGTSFGNYMFSSNTKLIGVGSIEKTINEIKAVEIQYIEGNGGIINTNHIPTLNTSMEFEMMPLEYTSDIYIGSAPDNGDDNRDFRFFATESGHIYFDFTNRRIDKNYIDFYVDEWYTVRCYNNGVTINGTTYTGSTATYSPYNCPIYIFGNTLNGPVNFKLKYLKIYENNVLVQDLIPVRVGSIGYIYDKISGQLFENQGTGNFILGPDKADAEEIIIEQETISSKLPESLTSTGAYTFYQCSNLKNIIIPSKVQSIGNYAFYNCTQLNNIEIKSNNLTSISQCAFYNCSKLENIGLYLPYDAEIEYLESTGTQWIDTGIEASWHSLCVELDMKLFNHNVNEVNFFGACDIATGGFNYAGHFNSLNGFVLQIGNSYIVYGNNDELRHTHIYDNINMQVSLDNNKKSYNSWLQSSGTFTIFQRITQNGLKNPSVNNLYGTKFYRNSQLILDLIPVRKGNIGYMYDKVSGKLFENKGTGDFVLGPDKN